MRIHGLITDPMREYLDAYAKEKQAKAAERERDARIAWLIKRMDQRDSGHIYKSCMREVGS